MKFFEWLQNKDQVLSEELLNEAKRNGFKKSI